VHAGPASRLSAVARGAKVEGLACIPGRHPVGRAFDAGFGVKMP
jgi:hypothetical protein